MTLTFDELVPDGSFALISSDSLGSDTLGGGPCEGALTGLDGPTPVVRRNADSNGSAVLSGDLPDGRCGDFVQAIDLSTCGRSAAVALP